MGRVCRTPYPSAAGTSPPEVVRIRHGDIPGPDTVQTAVQPVKWRTCGKVVLTWGNIIPGQSDLAGEAPRITQERLGGGGQWSGPAKLLAAGILPNPRTFSPATTARAATSAPPSSALALTRILTCLRYTMLPTVLG